MFILRCLSDHVKQSLSCSQPGTGAPAQLAGGGAVPSHAIAKWQLPNSAHLNLVFCVRPWPPGMLCSSGCLEHWCPQVLRRSQQGCPCCAWLSTQGPRCRLCPRLPHSAGLTHVVVRAKAQVRPEPGPGSEPSSFSCPSFFQGLITLPS